MAKKGAIFAISILSLLIIRCSPNSTAGTATGSGNARTVAVSGFMYDSLNCPLSKASVEIYSAENFSAFMGYSQFSTTDDSGHYVFPEVKQGSYHLLAFTADSSLASIYPDLKVDVDSGDQEVKQMIASPSGKLTFSFDTTLINFDQSMLIYAEHLTVKESMMVPRSILLMSLREITR